MYALAGIPSPFIRKPLPVDPWLNALQMCMMKASFVSTEAQRCRQEAEERLMGMTTEEEKMRFMVQLIGMDQRIMAHMLEATTRWKEDTICDLYMLVYHEVTTTRRSKMMILSYLLSHERVEPWMGADLLSWMIDDTDWEAYDVLTRFSFILTETQQQRMEDWAHGHRWADQQLGRVRGHHPLHGIDMGAAAVMREVVFPNMMERLPVLPLIVYNDRQNVHNTSINNSLWENIKILLDENHSTCEYDDYYQIRGRLGFLSVAQEKALMRIYTDRSNFSREKITVTLWNVFLLVWAYTMSVDGKEDIIARIREELGEMSGTCATGHLSRIVNALVGFHPQIQMRICEKDRLRAIFQIVLQSFLLQEEEADNLLCDMTHPEKNGLFHQFFLRSQSAMVDEVLERASFIDADEKSEAVKELRMLWENMYPLLFEEDFPPPRSNRLQQLGTFFIECFRSIRHALSGPF